MFGRFFVIKGRVRSFMGGMDAAREILIGSESFVTAPRACTMMRLAATLACALSCTAESNTTPSQVRPKAPAISLPLRRAAAASCAAVLTCPLALR